MTQAQCQQQLADYEALQQLWRERYALYAGAALDGSGESQGGQLDVAARCAISAGEDAHNVVGILRQGSTAQALRRDLGHYAALEYSHQIANQLTDRQSDPVLQPTRKSLEIEL